MIENDRERLSCFDSFFKTDKKLILVDQDDIAIFQEKIEDTNGDDDKVIVKAPRSVINDNLVLVGVRLSGRDFLFEMNDKSVCKNKETIRKKISSCTKFCCISGSCYHPLLFFSAFSC